MDQKEHDSMYHVYKEGYEYIEGVPKPGGGGTGSDDHSALQNLDFAVAGHTGFAAEVHEHPIMAHFTVEGAVPNQYLKCDLPFASIGDIQAWTDVGQFPPDIWDAMPAPTTTDRGGILLGDTGNPTKFLREDGQWMVVTSGTMDHTALSNLDYASSGHTGFSPAHSHPYEPANANIQAHIASEHQTIINSVGGAAFVKANGKVLSYDSTAYLPTADYTSADVKSKLSDWFVVVPNAGNPYLRCLYPFASDGDIQAFTDNGQFPPETIAGILPTGATDKFLRADGQWWEAGGGVSSWNDLRDKPATFPPASHNNTSHSETYITAAALLDYAPLANPAFTGNALFGNPAGPRVQLLDGGYIEIVSPLANDNLVIRPKGAGGYVMLNYGGGGGTKFYNGGTTEVASIDIAGLGTFKNLHVYSNTDGLARSIISNLSDGAGRRQDLAISVGDVQSQTIYLGVDQAEVFGSGIKSYFDNRSGGDFAYLYNGAKQMSIYSSTGVTSVNGLLIGGHEYVGFVGVYFDAVNQAADIRLGNLPFTGYVELSIVSTYSGANANGILTKTFTIGQNPDNSCWYYASRCNEAWGATPDQVAIGEYVWDAGISQYKIPISHRTALANPFTIKIRIYSHSNAYTAGSAITLSANYGLASLAKNVAYYPEAFTFGSTITSTDSLLSSDERLKENIRMFNPKPLNINYKEFNLKNNPSVLRFGVIAQELQKVAPELVREGQDGMLSVSYNDLFVREIVILKREIRKLNRKIRKLYRIKTNG